MTIDEVDTASDAELILECSDPELCYHAFLVIHSTVRGPALGGIRRWRYADRAAALEDALALARNMAYKSALADLPFGGAKSVIRDVGGASREALYRAHAGVMERLDGRYVGAEDLGTTRADVAFMRRFTRFLAGHTDPAPWTARGVTRGIQAAAMHRWQSSDLHDCTVALQGCGAVGTHLARELHDAGASLMVADPDAARARDIATRFGAFAVDPVRLLEMEADVLAPCALGGVLNREAIARLRVAIVAGAANNPLARDEGADVLAGRAILYVPDFVINAGGLMTAGVDLLGWPLAELERRVDGVYDATLQILEQAGRRGVTPLAVAERLAAGRLRHAAPSLASP